MEVENYLNNIIENNLTNNISKDLNVTEESQKSFLQTTLGKVINTGIDLGLRAIFPRLIEDQIIDIKNVMLTNRIKRRNKHRDKQSN